VSNDLLKWEIRVSSIVTITSQKRQCFPFCEHFSLNDFSSAPVSETVSSKVQIFFIDKFFI